MSSELSKAGQGTGGDDDGREHDVGGPICYEGDQLYLHIKKPPHTIRGS